MRTAAEQHMRELLNAAGCYQLTGETEEEQDLIAAGAELDLLSDEIETLFGDVFLHGATPECLELWESWLRPQRSVASIEQRRRMLQCLLAVNPEQGRLSDYDEVLYAAGVHGKLVENDAGLVVRCGGFLGLTETEVRRELDALLPAHLLWEIEPVFDWSTMEASGRSFAGWDALELNWAQLDSLTREEVLKGEKE